MTRASGNKLLLTAITCSLLQLLPAAGVRADPSLEGLSIDEAIAVLESGGEFILYSTDLVKPWMRVTAEPSHWPDAEKTLNEILTPYDLQARSGPENTIMIVRDPGSATLNTGGILGIVKETRTGRRIEGAKVSLNGKQESARTSNGGHFSFSNLPPGSYVVKINETEHAWVSTHMAEVKPGKTTVALIDLGSPLIADLGSVIVSASRYDFVRGGIASHTYIPSAELERVPNIGDDALRAVHRLPG
ncbi:MAG: carboxypeptidase-like regulatory domain-containing protein, partial [Gammaproteobacteria bacterium]